MSDLAEENYKSLLIVNESSDAWVTLYLYPTWDFLCWLSFESKIIKPNGGKYLHRSSKGFKFKLVARFKDGRRSKRTLQNLEEWDEDKLLKIISSLELTEGKLKDFSKEKRVCLRKAQRDNELKFTNGRRNLYEILGLDMNQVRKMPKEDQIKAIKKGFHKEIQRWHPDNNFGDDENAKEIILAYEILKDEEKRARYHNEDDYDSAYGWVSLKRWKAIFWPECVTEKQKKSYRHRMIMFALSFGITIGGITLTVVTGIIGLGLFGAGLQSLLHTVSRKSIVDECDNLWQQYKQWLIKAGIGFVGGAVTGGAAAGITKQIAKEFAVLSMGQFVGIGAGSGAVGGVAQSLATDAARKFSDGDHVTWKQVLGHAAVGAAVGAAAGAAGAAVTKSVVGNKEVPASAKIGEKIEKQLAIQTGAGRLGRILLQRIPRALTEKGTEAVMGSVAQFTEERLDDSLENRNPGTHLVAGVQNVAINALKSLAQETGGAIASHVWNEIKVDRRVKNAPSQRHMTPSIDDDTSVEGPRVDADENEQITYEKVKKELSEKNNEHRVNWRSHSKYSFSYQPLVSEEPSSYDQGTTLSTTSEEDAEDDVRDQSEVSDTAEDCKLKYISYGPWFSKMVVSYSLKGERVTQEVCRSEKSVTVPGNAAQLEVKFQVMRPFWGDLKKYHRFERRWCEPDQPHVFKFNTPPPLRTFTISGGLWYEAVMRVSDEYHDETGEM
ncbi:hypothetical protein P5673_025808 [Acropora cervicornis]|uniref:J domain-containing protein n=1 Tax=Acropora cervicornis TaxID=6130 RepID=A0AAD9Q158_ACRCE|nr:hypothetical protein P5673_025808 [Acropora cervicornis]